MRAHQDLLPADLFPFLSAEKKRRLEWLKEQSRKLSTDHAWLERWRDWLETQATGDDAAVRDVLLIHEEAAKHLRTWEKFEEEWHASYRIETPESVHSRHAYWFLDNDAAREATNPPTVDRLLSVAQEFVNACDDWLAVAERRWGIVRDESKPKETVWRQLWFATKPPPGKSEAGPRRLCELLSEILDSALDAVCTHNGMTLKPEEFENVELAAGRFDKAYREFRGIDWSARLLEPFRIDLESGAFRLQSLVNEVTIIRKNSLQPVARRHQQYQQYEERQALALERLPVPEGMPTPLQYREERDALASRWERPFPSDISKHVIDCIRHVGYEQPGAITPARKYIN